MFLQEAFSSSTDCLKMFDNSQIYFQITLTFAFGAGGREGRGGGRVSAQPDFLCMLLSALCEPELPHIALCRQKIGFSPVQSIVIEVLKASGNNKDFDCRRLHRCGDGG